MADRKKNRSRSHAKPYPAWKKVLLILVTAAALAAIIACGYMIALNNKKSDQKRREKIEETTMADESLSEAETSSEKTVYKITPSNDNIYIVPNKTKRVMLTIDAKSKKDIGEISWKSSDESIAKVSKTGDIEGVKAGACVVCADAGGAECKINVVVKDLQVRDGITYIDNIMIVNKEFGLPSSYNPGDILPEVKSAFEKLSDDAKKEGLNIYIGSGFRTYEYQEEIFGNYTDMYGEEYANTFSSKPGHSEHQSGYAIDCNTIDDDFGLTKESDWLETHCAEYGFIVRFPQNKESVTGYSYEPWHIRYVGKTVAQDIKKQGICLEEYLGVDEQKYKTASDISETIEN